MWGTSPPRDLMRLSAWKSMRQPESPRLMCWSVTGWALVAALVVGVFGTVLAGEGTAELATITDAKG